MSGAIIAFFAFIGFEDIVNMAEEVSRPERTLPRAILLSLAIRTARDARLRERGLVAVAVDPDRPPVAATTTTPGGEG